jgi:hypothetical protein
MKTILAQLFTPLFLQILIVLAVYTIGVVIKARDPLRFYSDYPPKIRERIAALPQYKDKIPTSRKTYGVKIAAFIVLCGILAGMCLWAAATTFAKAFVHVFIIITSANLYDLLILDLIWFCRGRHFRIPGTEDMVKEYQDPSTHLKGFVVGLGLSLIASALVGAVIQLLSP